MSKKTPKFFGNENKKLLITTYNINTNRLLKKQGNNQHGMCIRLRKRDRKANVHQTKSGEDIKEGVRR